MRVLSTIWCLNGHSLHCNAIGLQKHAVEKMVNPRIGFQYTNTGPIQYLLCSLIVYHEATTFDTQP